MQQIKKNESVAGLRTVPLEIFGTDGLTPDATKNGDQPQISYNGGAFIDTDNTLVHITGESYSLELSQIEVDVDDLTQIKVRFADVDIVPSLAWAQILETTNKEILDAVELNAPQQHFAGATSTVLDGVTVSGSYLNTFIDDDVSWVIRPDGTGMDVRFAFNVGVGRLAFQVSLNGMFDANPLRSTDAYVYNHVTLAEDKISNVDTRMNNSSSHKDYTWFLTSQHTDPTTGDVLIRLASTSTNVGDRLEIDRVFLLSLSEASGLTPENIAEAVWAHIITGHEAHDTAAFYLIAGIRGVGEVIAVTDASNFQVNNLEQSANTLVGMAIFVHDESALLYYKGIIKTNDAAGNIELYEPLGILPQVGAGAIIRNRNFDYKHNSVDVGTIGGAPITGEVVKGTFQKKITTAPGREQIIYRGDVPTLQLVADTSWNFTGKDVWFSGALDPGGATAISRKATVTGLNTAEITLTDAETDLVGRLRAEWSETSSGVTDDPLTIQRFNLVIRQDIKQ